MKERSEEERKGKEAIWGKRRKRKEELEKERRNEDEIDAKEKNRSRRKKKQSKYRSVLVKHYDLDVVGDGVIVTIWSMMSAVGL